MKTTLIKQLLVVLFWLANGRDWHLRALLRGRNSRLRRERERVYRYNVRRAALAASNAVH